MIKEYNILIFCFSFLTLGFVFGAVIEHGIQNKYTVLIEIKPMGSFTALPPIKK